MRCKVPTQLSSRPNIGQQYDVGVLANVKKDPNSTLKYAALGTQTKQNSYKQGCGVGISEVACFRAESEHFFIRFNELN